MHQRNAMSRKAQKLAKERARRRRQGLAKARGDQQSASSRQAAWDRKNPTRARARKKAMAYFDDQFARVMRGGPADDGLLSSLKNRFGL